LVVLLALLAPVSASAELARGSRSAGDGWIVQVSVEPTDLGPISVSVGRIRPAPPGSQAWLQHDLVFENTGDRRVTFADTRTAALLGPSRNPVLLAGDNGCGYSRVKPLVGACLLNLDFPSVKPRRSVMRTVTLWKGLPGMKSLTPGTYVFRKSVRFRLGREIPPPGTGRAFTLRIVYRVDSA
jgi:hypothetical protein